VRPASSVNVLLGGVGQDDVAREDVRLLVADLLVGLLRGCLLLPSPALLRTQGPGSDVGARSLRSCDFNFLKYFFFGCNPFPTNLRPILNFTPRGKVSP
jgi:hypothetical protein